MKKKFFSLFLIFTLCFVNVNQCYADAGSIIIGGGSIAGVAAGAIAGPAVVAVFCAMMAFGMNVELTRASEEAGMTKTEFLKNKIQQYCNEARISATTFNSYVLDQANVFQNGAISLTDKAGNLIEKFCNWLFSSEAVSNPTTGIADTVVINGLTCPVIQPGMSYRIFNVYTDEITVIYNHGSKPFALCGFYSVQDGRRWVDVRFITSDYSAFNDYELMCQRADGQYDIINTPSRQFGNMYIGLVMKSYYEDTSDINVPIYEGLTFDTPGNVLNHFAEGVPAISFDNLVGTDSVTGTYEDYDVSKGLLNPTNDQTIVVNPNVTIPVPQDIDVTIDVNEYLDKLKDILDGVADHTIGAIDDSTGIPIDIDFDPTIDWDPTIELEQDTDLPPEDERTPVVEDDRIPIDYDIEPLKFDLKGVFPFCLPWDIKDMLNKLNADPVAPSYTVDWDLPYIEENLTFTIDFSPYDNVASLLRKLEVLSFCVGLALITRQMILRG